VFNKETKPGADIMVTKGVPPSGLTIKGIIMSLFSPIFIVYSVPLIFVAYPGARLTTSTVNKKGNYTMPSVRTTLIVCMPQWARVVGVKDRRVLPDIGSVGEGMTEIMETVSPSASGLINPEMSWIAMFPLVINILGRSVAYPGRLFKVPTRV
jgi:hypothetical protein